MARSTFTLTRFTETGRGRIHTQGAVGGLTADKIPLSVVNSIALVVADRTLIGI
ncbi:hypothetical protein [Nocardia salmonicida]|uniref:hypothetical protein n=1 Tax=Nocardia salmonicida TaxID=53431 RepID=UPI00362D2922